MQLDTAVFHLLRRAMQEHSARWQARLPQVTKPQYAVLRVIGARPGIEQSALGVQAAIDKATLAAMLLRMEERGLLRRSVDPGDRRRRLLELTAAGHAELRSAAPVADRVDAEMLDRLSPEERAQLHDLLVKLAPVG